MGPRALIALQRSAGNAAVNALMAGRLRSPGEQAVTDIDAALREIRRDEPAIDTVEKGLKAAKAAGVPVDLEGPKPPASALAVTKTGFGPGSVAAEEAGAAAEAGAGGQPARQGGARRRRLRRQGPAGGAPAAAPAGAGGGGGGAAAMAPAPLAADQLLQPPVPPTGVRTRGRSGVHPGHGQRQGLRQGQARAPAGRVEGQGGAGRRARPDRRRRPGRPRRPRSTRWTPSRPGTFDKKAFIAAVKAAIEAKSPKTLKEADDYKESGKAGEVKGEVKGLVTQGKEGQAKDIETATDAPPGPVQGGAEAGHADGPGAAGAGGADPGRGRRAQAGAGRAAQPRGRQARRPTRRWPTREVTEPQLAQSNEPEFQQALADKKAAAAHADTAPGEFRAAGAAGHRRRARPRRPRRPTQGVAGMQGAKGAALAKLVADKGKTKSKDEAKRAEVTAKIQGIFAATEADVKKILDGIDPKVEKEFEQGEAAARAAFESYVAAKMSAYKKDRYGGWLGGLRWAKDKLLGMPDKVNEFYEAGRELYLKQMDGVISRVADIVGDDLTAAKKRIATGKTEIASYVKSLPDGPAEGRGGGVEGDRRQVRAARERRQRQAGRRSSTPWPRSTSRRARVSTSGSRSCRPRTRAWSTRRSARSRPSSTRSASSPRC